MNLLDYISDDVILIMIYVGGLSACFCLAGVVELIIEWLQRVDSGVATIKKQEQRKRILWELRGKR